MDFVPGIRCHSLRRQECGYWGSLYLAESQINQNTNKNTITLLWPARTRNGFLKKKKKKKSMASDFSQLLSHSNLKRRNHSNKIENPSSCFRIYETFWHRFSIGGKEMWDAGLWIVDLCIDLWIFLGSHMFWLQNFYFFSVRHGEIWSGEN